MDSDIQILRRFQDGKQKVPPLSLPCAKKSHFTPSKERINRPLGEGMTKMQRYQVLF